MAQTSVPAPQTDEFLQQEVDELRERINANYLPTDLKQKTLGMVDRLLRMAKYGGYSTEYENVTRYIDWVVSLPWRKMTEDSLNLDEASKILNQHHYGLGKIKERLLEYLAVLQLHQRLTKSSEDQSGTFEENGEVTLSASEETISRAPIMLFVGLVGTGKTTLAYAIADAMNREFARIPFGGMGDAAQLRGQSRSLPDAEPGQVIKALRQAQSRNPVILLDEIDRVAEQARADIMGVLVELLDPEQNSSFVDHYIDYPFNLSQVLFVATCNNTTNISTAVLDRLEPLQMPSYTDEQKIAIGKDYILPKAIADAGLKKDSIIVDEAVWPLIVRPLGFDAGIRTLERTIKGMCRKVAKQIVEGEGKQFFITEENVREYIPVE